jgi:hypothetical protein
MKSSPFMLIAGFATLAAIGCFAFYAWKRMGMAGASEPGALDAVMQNGALIFALIAAFWTLWLTARNNETAWLAYSQSTRPSALFWVDNEFDGAGAPVTRINYRNASNNDVDRMRAKIRVFTNEESVDLSDLLPTDLLLPAGDSRNRRFPLYNKTAERGFDMRAKADAGEEIKMEIGYSYVHGGKRISIPVQQRYVWVPANQRWDLEH